MTLKYNCFLILFFYCALLFSQSLEEQIYAATESFIAQKSQESFNELLKKEESFIPNIKTKDEQLAYVFLLCNKGFFYDESNKKMEAIESYENAWTRFKSNNLQTLTNYDIIEFCLKPLGNLYTKTNNYTSAESTIKQYMALAKSSDKTPQYISGVINLSILYQSLGKHQSVLGLIQSTETISGISKSQKEHLQSLKAKSEIANGKRLLDDDIIFPNQSQLASTHLLQYQASLKAKDYQGALKNLNLYKAYADIKTFPKREIAKLKFQEAQLLYLLNQYETCEQVLNSALSYLLPLYKKGLPESTQLYAENTFIDIFDLKAQIQENPLTALAYFDLSFHVSGLLTKQLTSQQAIIENMAQNRQRSESCLAILYNLYKTQDNDAVFSQALNYAETYKAYTLKGMFEEKSLLEQYPNDSLLIKSQTLRQKQEHLTDVLIKQELNYVEQINLDSINSALLDINLELKALEKQIAEKYSNETRHIDVKQLQGKLAQDNAVLVEYFYGKEHLYQFIISKSNTSFKQLPLNEDLLSGFIHLFDDASKINNNVSGYTKSAFNCYQSLNLKKVGNTETLIIVRDGLLNFIPFDALLTAEATTESFSAMPFLVLSKQITYNASISLYLKNDTQSYGNAVLGVFPVFENTSQPLTYSLDEAHNLKKLTHATLQLKETATKTNFK
ncbi:MAG TPA: hypothetical protein VKZ97_07630, partial [Flavobacteriaceae bacterium]|nr:hypothetical protein [Flavobacteriaceae bacterium]